MCFFDYGIALIGMYSRLECARKRFYKPDLIEAYFANFCNNMLYEKQKHLPLNVPNDVLWLVHLIDVFKGVVEQEIINDKNDSIIEKLWFDKIDSLLPKGLRFKKRYVIQL